MDQGEEIARLWVGPYLFVYPLTSDAAKVRLKQKCNNRILLFFLFDLFIRFFILFLVLTFLGDYQQYCGAKQRDGL